MHNYAIYWGQSLMDASSETAKLSTDFLVLYHLTVLRALYIYSGVIAHNIVL